MARSNKPEPERASSTDLTGAEQGREPTSQDVDIGGSSSESPAAAANWNEMDASGASGDDAIDVEELDADLFRSKSLWQPARARGVFGGQVIGMGVTSSSRTIRKEMTLHSLHCYFLLAGNRDRDIIYKVIRIRDGGSYCTRQVNAQQDGKIIFTMLLSYQVPEPAQPSFAIPLPNTKADDSSQHVEGGGRVVTTLPTEEVFNSSSSFTRSPTPNSLIESLPSPEDCPLNEQRYIDVLSKYGSTLPSKIKSTLEAWITDRKNSPVEIRNALPGMYDSNGLPSKGYEQAFWLKCKRPISGNAEMQKAALAYSSDFQFLSTVPKALHNSPRIKMMASLDHSMWFYDNDFKADQWLLFVMQTQAAGHGRGVALGRIYRQDGVLVAVVAQEGMVREKVPRKEENGAKSSKL
ncbi:unnamed protein product [Sympodiomycopsis kandeliae]